MPQLNELYELQLAYYESRILSSEETIQRGAYFARVGGRPTRHFLICQGEPLRLAEHSSSRLKAFFKTNQFKTGYATHGLFPYRGKFHPQMVKALLNVMGLRPGETVLDPMMGSGTTLIEATLMGIHSVGLDASPFCRFMTQAKLDGLQVEVAPLLWAMQHTEAVFDYFTRTFGHPTGGKSMGGSKQTALSLGGTSKGTEFSSIERALSDEKVRNYLLLAYLDSAGYSIRSQRRPPLEQFRAILERYAFVAKKMQSVLRGVESEMGHGVALVGDARQLPLKDGEVQGILFSPPYSFAIDYIANDEFHLRSMGVEIPPLRACMIGLRGKDMRQKYDLYMRDMSDVLRECHRVLESGRVCTIVVGTNNQQLARILGVAVENVKTIDAILMGMAEETGLSLVRRIERQITGMANTMRTESILFLQKR